MVVKVMMAEWKTAPRAPTVSSVRLGSCVAVIIYDPLVKVAAMAHVMLPYSKMDKSSSVFAKRENTPIRQFPRW